MNKMMNMPEIRLGIVAVSRDCFPASLSAGRRTAVCKACSAKGIDVYESPIQTMKDCSVVTATYELGEGVRGTIGIVGPKRMDYEKVMDNLKTLKNSLDGILNKDKEQT